MGREALPKEAAWDMCGLAGPVREGEVFWSLACWESVEWRKKWSLYIMGSNWEKCLWSRAGVWGEGI